MKIEFNEKQVEALHDVISAMNAKDVQRKIYYNIEKILEESLSKTSHNKDFKTHKDSPKVCSVVGCAFNEDNECSKSIESLCDEKVRKPS